MKPEEIKKEVWDLVNSIIDIADADSLKWAAEELLITANNRHEAEKIKGGGKSGKT